MQRNISLGQQVQPSVLSRAERTVKNLKAWLRATNSVGTSVMEEPVTNQQMLGAAFVPAGLTLAMLAGVSMVFALVGVALLAAGAQLLREEEEGGEL